MDFTDLFTDFFSLPLLLGLALFTPQVFLDSMSLKLILYYVHVVVTNLCWLQSEWEFSKANKI